MVQTQSKTLKVTISGSYRSANRQIESFENVTGIIPRLDPDKAEQMVIRRYAAIWIQKAKVRDTDEPKYKHIQSIRTVFIDSTDDNDEHPNALLSYVGKNIMEMNFEELQDFAAANDLAGVPLYKAGSLTHARRVAFSEYAIKVLHLEEYTAEDKDEKQNLYDYRVLGFNPNRFEPIVADAKIRRQGQHAASIEETIDREAAEALQGRKKGPAAAPESKGSRMTFEQLKAVAIQRNIPFHKGISYEALHKKIYGAQAA